MLLVRSDCEGRLLMIVFGRMIKVVMPCKRV